MTRSTLCIDTLVYFEHFRRNGLFVQSAERGSVQSALHLDNFPRCLSRRTALYTNDDLYKIRIKVKGSRRGERLQGGGNDKGSFVGALRWDFVLNASNCIGGFLLSSVATETENRVSQPAEDFWPSTSGVEVLHPKVG